jgi:phosphatidylserine decarboxylase precursor
MNVGRIRAVYDDVVTNARRTRAMQRKTYEQPIPVAKGGELAIFEMGSTVVVVFSPGVKLASDLQPGKEIKLGEPLEATA